MSELVTALMNPGTMTQAQWLILAIAAFILIGAAYFVFMLIRLIKSIGKSTYKPNIGLSRLEGYKPSSVRNRKPAGEDSELDDEIKSE